MEQKLKRYEDGLALGHFQGKEEVPDFAGFVCRLLSVSRIMNKFVTARNILRKEVIQPQVPLRLPCYDFTPVAEPTVVRCLLQAGWRTAFG